MEQQTFGPDDEEAFQARRDELVAEFGDWIKQFPLRGDPEDLGLLLDWKWGYGDGRLDRWCKSDLHEFLLDWCPRKLVAPPDLAKTIPAGVAMAMSFLASRGLQTGGDRIEQLTEYPMHLHDDFMAAMTDQAHFGLGKSIFAGICIEDPTALDADGLQQAMDAFNALPEEQRRAVTDAAIEGPSSALPTIGPVQLPDAQAVRSSAEAAAVLAGFAVLADYFAAPGKTLTNAGNLKLADARELVKLLGTSDEDGRELGGEVIRRRSSTQFVELDHWAWWARESGAVQRRGNKLVGVKAWQQRRRKDPVAEVRRAFNVLVEYGPLASYWQGYGGSARGMLDQSVGPLLGRLLQSGGPVEYDELLESWTDMMAAVVQRGPYSGSINRSFDQLITLLERAGLVCQEGAVRTSDQWLTDRSGGTVQMTAVGVVIAVELLQEQGIPVEILSRPEEMTAAAVAALASTTSLDPVEWWRMAIGWLDVQPDARGAVGDLIAELRNRDLLLLMVALEEAPDSARDRLAPVLHELALSTDPPPGELGSAAVNWLLKHGQLDPNEIDPDALLDSHLVTYGVFAEAGTSIMPALEAECADVAEQLEFIAAAGRRLPPRVIDLLESIGSEHPNKAVAKAARKELFRVRSKPGSRGPIIVEDPGGSNRR